MSASYSGFIEHFHKLLARSQNTLRGRWENFWACEQTCVVKLVEREAVIDKLVHTAANPVQDHLVDRALCWPGVNGLGALLAGRSSSASFGRPSASYRRKAALCSRWRPAGARRFGRRSPRYGAVRAGNR
jgi:hypothetical protein